MDENDIEEKLSLLDQLQSACTHCGLCSEGCITFQSKGWEHESPRGRLHLAAQFLHGRIHPDSEALSTFDRCLGCQACEPLCPHQVPYHHIRGIVQELRRELNTSSVSVVSRDEYQQWINLAKRTSHVWWRRFGAKWLNIPVLKFQSLGSFSNKRKRPKAGQPVLSICCIQDLFHHEAIEQALTFMQRLGYSLEVDRSQPCCGAIFERLVQGGEGISYPQEQRRAAFLQNKARNAFLKWMPPQTYFLSRICQSWISNHRPVLDLYDWIEAVLDQEKITLTLLQPQVVYYQSYCGHQKGEADSVCRLLQRIEGLTIRALPDPEACCGGCGYESLWNPEHAQFLASRKISSLPQHATVIVASPDCWALFKSHPANQDLIVCYPIQLLSQAVIKKTVANVQEVI